jgi:hypothetical protein
MWHQLYDSHHSATLRNLVRRSDALISLQISPQRSTYIANGSMLQVSPTITTPRILAVHMLIFLPDAVAKNEEPPKSTYGGSSQPGGARRAAPSRAIDDEEERYEGEGIVDDDDDDPDAWSRHG